MKLKIFKRDLSMPRRVAGFGVLKYRLIAFLAVFGPGFITANVCSGQPISILEVATALCDARGAELSPVVTGRYRSGDVRHIVADPARAAEVLNFRAAVSPSDGLREFAFAPLR